MREGLNVFSGLNGWVSPRKVTNYSHNRAFYNYKNSGEPPVFAGQRV